MVLRPEEIRIVPVPVPGYLHTVLSRVVDPYSFFTDPDPDPDPVDPDGGQYGSGPGSNPDPGL